MNFIYEFIEEFELNALQGSPEGRSNGGTQKSAIIFRFVFKWQRIIFGT